MPGNRNYRPLGLVAICAMLLAACASAPPAPTQAPVVHSQFRHHPVARRHSPVARLAVALVGAPYRYGGSTPRGFDCSGLVYYTYRKNGIRVPRSTHAQYRKARHIPRRELKPGDLVFFKTDRHKVSHVGIYTGHDRFVHAPSRGKEVSFASLDDDYWRRHYVGAGRYF